MYTDARLKKQKHSYIGTISFEHFNCLSALKPHLMPNLGNEVVLQKYLAFRSVHNFHATSAMRESAPSLLSPFHRVL